MIRRDTAQNSQILCLQPAISDTINAIKLNVKQTIKKLLVSFTQNSTKHDWWRVSKEIIKEIFYKKREILKKTVGITIKINKIKITEKNKMQTRRP